MNPTPEGSRDPWELNGIIKSAAAEEIDYYKLPIAEPTTVTLRFSFAQSTIKNTTFVMNVEQNGQTLWNASIKGDSGGVEQQLRFPAGEYYSRMKLSTLLGTVYTIEVK